MMSTKHDQPGNRKQPAALLVKNMVCNRCIRVVREELEHMGFPVRSVELGEVTLAAHPDAEQRAAIAEMLRANGFELIEDRNARLVEKIKHAVIRLIYHENLEQIDPSGYSDYIAREVGRDARSLGALFSAVEHTTIEHYIILQKVERVKELMKYGELTVAEISYRLGYSSPQHLSGQFKKITGLTPREFSTLLRNARTPIDQVTPKHPRPAGR